MVELLQPAYRVWMSGSFFGSGQTWTVDNRKVYVGNPSAREEIVRCSQGRNFSTGSVSSSTSCANSVLPVYLELSREPIEGYAFPQVQMRDEAVLLSHSKGKRPHAKLRTPSERASTEYLRFWFGMFGQGLSAYPPGSEERMRLRRDKHSPLQMPEASGISCRIHKANRTNSRSTSIPKSPTTEKTEGIFSWKGNSQCLSQGTTTSRELLELFRTTSTQVHPDKNQGHEGELHLFTRRRTSAEEIDT